MGKSYLIEVRNNVPHFSSPIGMPLGRHADGARRYLSTLVSWLVNRMIRFVCVAIKARG